MLALYYVLARAGIVLDQAAPLLMAVRKPHEAPGAAEFARLVATLIAATRARPPR